MSKLTNKNSSKTWKNVAPLPLQLTLNTLNTLIHCSIEWCAKTTQNNSTIYHSSLSCKTLAAPDDMSPTRTGNPIHDPGGIFNFLKVQTKFELKDSKNIYYKNFELWRSLLDYLISVVSVNLESFVLSIYKNSAWVLLEFESGSGLSL